MNQNLFGYDITPFYIHINNEIPLFRAKKDNVKINTFLNYESGVTGLQRELFISKLEGSLVSYKEENGALVPVTAEIEYNRTARQIISEIQKAALDFVSDMSDIFGEQIEFLFFSREDASLPYEYFLIYPKLADRRLFTVFNIEDELGTGDGKINFNDYWDMQLGNMYKDTPTVAIQTVNSFNALSRIKSKWLKAFYLLCMDRKTLKARIRNRYKNKKIRLNLLRFGYRICRKMYRICRH